MAVHFATPDEAETAFYAAFESADLAAMAAVWSDSATVECIHPMGERLRGREAVLASWRGLFTESPRLRFALSHRSRIGDERVAVHVLFENIDVPERDTPPAQMIATNVYRHEEGGWRLVLHHASPAPRHAQAPSHAVH